MTTENTEDTEPEDKETEDTNTKIDPYSEPGGYKKFDWLSGEFYTFILQLWLGMAGLNPLVS